jgi:predicted DNA-binding transcriptional regulator AlpA
MSGKSEPSVDLSRLKDAPDCTRLRVREVAAMEGMSVASVWRHARIGNLPKSSKTGGITTWGLGDLRRRHDGDK